MSLLLVFQEQREEGGIDIKVLKVYFGDTFRSFINRFRIKYEEDIDASKIVQFRDCHLYENVLRCLAEQEQIIVNLARGAERRNRNIQEAQAAAAVPPELNLNDVIAIQLPDDVFRFHEPGEVIQIRLPNEIVQAARELRLELPIQLDRTFQLQLPDGNEIQMHPFGMREGLQDDPPGIPVILEIPYAVIQPDELILYRLPDEMNLGQLIQTIPPSNRVQLHGGAQLPNEIDQAELPNGLVQAELPNGLVQAELPNGLVQADQLPDRMQLRQLDEIPAGQLNELQEDDQRDMARLGNGRIEDVQDEHLITVMQRRQMNILRGRQANVLIEHGQRGRPMEPGLWNARVRGYQVPGRMRRRQPNVLDEAIQAEQGPQDEEDSSE